MQLGTTKVPWFIFLGQLPVGDVLVVRFLRLRVGFDTRVWD